MAGKIRLDLGMAMELAASVLMLKTAAIALSDKNNNGNWNKVTWSKKLILSLSILCVTSLWFSANAYAAADEDYRDTWTTPGGDAPDKEVPGWLVNLGPTGARAVITKTSFIVRYIFKDSPAVGKLNLEDEIVGVFGKPFNPNPVVVGRFGYDGPIKEFGEAIEKAEGQDGKLILNVKRGSNTAEVTINLEVIGTFSPTFPINCKKSELLRARALKYFFDHPEADGACNTRSAICLALLSSDDPNHQAIAKERILKWAAELPDEGTWSWPAAYQLITLGEYHLLTKDPSVLPTMKLCVEHLEKIQYKHPIDFGHVRTPDNKLVVNGVTFDYDELKAAIDLYDGGFGHGSPGGYGPMQYTTILAVIGWQLAERSGLTVTPARMDSAFKYIHYGTNASGALAYGSEFTFGGYAIEDPLDFGRQTGGERAVGKSGAALIAHKLAAERPDLPEYIDRYKAFYKSAYAGLPNGHADGNLNLFWGFVGAGAADDEAILRTTMDYFKSYINMSRCFDGSFVTQPNRHSGDDDAYYHSSRYNATASMALALGLNNPKLHIQVPKDDSGSGGGSGNDSDRDGQPDDVDTDDDNDGFPDDLEVLLNTNPKSPSDTPFGGAPSGIKQPLTVNKMQVRLNFSKPGNDSIAISGTLALASTTTAQNSKVAMFAGGIAKSFILDSKGRSTPKSKDAFKVSGKAKKGVVGLQPYKYSIKLSKSDFASLLADDGLTNSDVKNKSLQIPLILLFGNSHYEKTQAQLYSASTGKSGKTKTPK